METRAIHFSIKNEKTAFNVKAYVEPENAKKHISEVFALKRLLKSFNEKVMPEICKYPTQLIEEELKEYLNEVSNLNIVSVEVERVNLLENEK